jgi:D-amino-acid oxidase
VRGFQHDAGLVHAPGLNADPGICDAYAHVAPMIDTDRYMAWLMNQVHQAGCQVTQGRVDGRLSDKAAALRRLFKADCIVNCTGLGARDLGDETMYPLRGAILRVCNDGRQFPRVVEAHCVAQAEPGDDQSFIFIVPRGEETLILGGFSEPRAWDLSIGLHNCQRVRQVWQRCTRFLPALANARLDPVEPVRAGLRPYRPCNVRLDAEPETNIIHNYGHGGAGVTFSWGCAREACQLVEQRLGLAVTPAS